MSVLSDSQSTGVIKYLQNESQSLNKDEFSNCSTALCHTSAQTIAAS